MNLKTKINEQAEQKQDHRYRENFDGCQVGQGLGEMGEKCEGIKKYKLVFTNSYGDVKYSKGNIVNDSLITMHGVRWVPGLLGWSLIKLCNV